MNKHIIRNRSFLHGTLNANEISLGEIGSIFIGPNGRYSTKDLLRIFSLAKINPTRIVAGRKQGTQSRIYERSLVMDFFKSTAGLSVSPIECRSKELSTEKSVSLVKSNEILLQLQAIQSMYNSTVGGDFHTRWLRTGLPFTKSFDEHGRTQNLYNRDDVATYFMKFGRVDRLNPDSTILQKYFPELTASSNADKVEVDRIVNLLKTRPAIKRMVMSSI